MAKAKDNKPDLSFVTADELLDEVRKRFKVLFFVGIPNDGEGYNQRTFMKCNDNPYEAFGLVDVAKAHLIQDIINHSDFEAVDEEDEDEPAS